MNENEIDELAAEVADEIRAERSMRVPVAYLVDEDLRGALDRDDERLS